ncbi:MAG: bifunctional diaminohydroxyphosphoribosylaminopyrimidine deaminase/5-amino-6-(5-phosphoribosylamino)uracil reductase RibD [Sphingobium sp.]
MIDDARAMAAAIALSHRGAGRTGRNPNVGCVIVGAEGHVVGRGWTQPGGRPHAEAMALTDAGERARGATAYVTLEPCAHASERGPRCCDLLVAAGLARVVIAAGDPDPRTNGRGVALLHDSGIAAETGLLDADARRAMAGYFTRARLERPHVTLKLALSLDGCIALADGSSRWITGPDARAHAHVERARADAILVGRGTLTADSPRLDVRLSGLSDRAPLPVLLSRSAEGLPAGWLHAPSPESVATLDLPGDRLLVEGGAGAAAAFLRAGMVDRLLIYRAPILIGGGTPSLGDIGLTDLSHAHGRWRLVDRRLLGVDSLEVYEAAQDG